MPRGVSRADEARLQGRLWTPANIGNGNLRAWVDAADLSTVTTVSGAVSSWASKGGMTAPATQSTSTNRPSQRLNDFNGLSVHRFDGNNDRLDFGTQDFARNVPRAIVAEVAQIRTYKLNGRHWWCDRSGGSPRVALRSSSTGQFIAQGRRLDANSTAGVTSVATMALNTWYIRCVLFNFATGDIFQYINGTLDPTSTNVLTSGNTSDTTVNQTSIGATSSGDNPAAIDVGEMLFIDRSWEVKQIEGYLAWKWGIPLVGTHPFANRPPLISD